MPKVTKEIRALVKDMEQTMDKAKGLGIAAPQVARTERVCITVLDGKVTPMVNPTITKKGKEIELDLEGCLSLPGVWLMVPRSVEINVSYLDAAGKEHTKKLKHLDARVVQHEVDHLDGVLIVDYAPKEPHS